MCSQKRQRKQGGKDGTRRAIAFLLSRILQHLHAFFNMLPAHTALLSVTLLKYPNITYQLNMETAVRNITEMRRTRTFPFLYSERLKFQSSRKKYCRLKEVNESVKKLLYPQAQTESVLFLQFPLWNSTVFTTEFQCSNCGILCNGSNMIK